MGSNGPITAKSDCGDEVAKSDAVKTFFSGLIFSAQTAVRFVRERSSFPPGQRNVDYRCFDEQRMLDHITERL